MRNRTLHPALTYAAAAAFLSTVVLANYLIDRFGIVPVGFGQVAPAAAAVVGPALVLRDVVHRQLGVRWALGLVAAGAVLSLLVADPRVAVASAVAFAVAEGIDLLLYGRLRERRGMVVAVLVSGLVGAVLDSIVFLWLAFGSLTFLPGQLLVKVYGLLLGLLLLLTRRDAA